MSRGWRELRARLLLLVAIGLVWGLCARRNAELRAQLAEARERARATLDVDRLEHALTDMRAQLPPPAAPEDWYGEHVLEAARRAGVAPPAITAQDPSEFLGALPLRRVTLETTGEYRQLVAFVDALERFRPRWRLARLRVQPGQGARLRATVSMLVVRTARRRS